MQPGIYRLTQEVVNPMKIDRRRADWVHRVKFEAGTLFILSDRDGILEQPVHRVGLREYSVWVYKSQKHTRELLDALRPHLELIDHKSDLHMLMLYYKEVLAGSASFEGIIRTLLKNGRLTLDDINVMLAQLNPDVDQD